MLLWTYMLCIDFVVLSTCLIMAINSVYTVIQSIIQSWSCKAMVNTLNGKRETKVRIAVRYQIWAARASASMCPTANDNQLTKAGRLNRISTMGICRELTERATASSAILSRVTAATLIRWPHVICVLEQAGMFFNGMGSPVPLYSKFVP